MSQSYDLAANMQRLLATLEEQDEEDAPTPDAEEQAAIHVYPVAGGGILFSKVLLEQEEPTIVESQEEPDTEIPWTKYPTTSGNEPPPFLLFLLILCFFLLFDMADSQITALLTPTITVTLTPKAHAIKTTVTLPIGANGNGVPGRVLPELTLSQTQITQATGHGHQDARAASGILTFYNGSFSAQTVYAGTVFRGADGIQVATDQTGMIPPNIPPQDGQAPMAAHALQAGQAGNIQALDINGTISSSLFVKNLAPFSGGQNERDFATVTRDDIQRVVTGLTPHLLQSEQAALSAQLTASEALAPLTCGQHVTADHAVGSEATTVQVTISETCTAVAYNQQAIQVQASQLLTSMAATQLGTGYTRTGSIQVTVKQAPAPNTPVVVSLALVGTWVYTFSPQEQQHLKMLIARKTKSQAVQLLLSQQGIGSVTIAGIRENEQVPDDLTHIHLLIMVEG